MCLRTNTWCASSAPSAPRPKKSCVLEKHEDSSRHKNNLRLHKEGIKTTLQFLFLTTISNSSDNIFNQDLVKALISDNIYLHKIQNTEMKTLLEAYSKKIIPSTARLMATMEKESSIMMVKIKEKVKGRSLLVFMDGSKNSLSKATCVGLAGLLDGDVLEKPYLIDLVKR
ncbi:hypothetical protein TCAL_14265 [Tigriopus californicus]|uniref:DUF4371 domain-containing protein n=1 Tax=Tigriopus californicus TaxID=6832 RepID=A0A553NSI2_TIGCA|nr:hypothetical protein TCAL_14265 [Tigriopus californicus]